MKINVPLRLDLINLTLCILLDQHSREVTLSKWLYSLIPLWVTLAFIDGHSFMRRQLGGGDAHFHENFSISLGGIMGAATIGCADLLKFILNLSYSVIIQGKGVSCDFIKCVYGFCLHLDPYELISFNIGMMIIMAELCSLVAVLMTLTIIQGHRIMRNLEFLQSFWC